MRTAIIVSGVVQSLTELPPGAIIATGGASATVATTYEIEPFGGTPETVEYTATIEAPAGAMFVATDTADAGWTYASGTFSPPTTPKATLIAEAQAKQAAIAVGGISVNVGSGSVEAATDSASLVLLQGAYAMAQANGSATFQWVQSNGAAVTLTAAQITTIFNAVTAFVQSTFTTLAAVIAAINAGTVTTMSAVNAFASPAWPANS